MKLATISEIEAAEVEANQWLTLNGGQPSFESVKFIAKRSIMEYILNKKQKTMFKQ